MTVTTQVTQVIKDDYVFKAVHRPSSPELSVLNAPVDARYSERIWQAFTQPSHVGVVPNTRFKARASDPLTLTDVSVTAAIEAGIIIDFKFKARACPYTLAVLELFIEESIGTNLLALEFNARAWVNALGIPVERLTRLLVIDSAIQALKDRHSTAADSGRQRPTG